ncbi:MAG TPA: hypothetical protein VIX83_03285 [Candidatus Cybelea sp.]
MRRSVQIGILVVAAFLCCGRVALADTYDRLDVSGTSIGFSSPGNAYGPWIIQDAKIVFVTPGVQAINFEVAHQADGDVAFPTHGEYFAAGINHSITSRLYGDFNFGYGTSNPYSHTNAHLEFDYKTTPDLRLVMAAAEDYVTYWGGTTLKQFSVGPEYYYPGGDVQLRYLVAANTGSQTKSGLLAAWDITPTIRSKYSATGLFGSQQYLVSIPGLPQALANDFGQTYTVGTEQQLGRTTQRGARWGIEANGFFSHLVDATNGAPVYQARGVTFGIWSIF